MAIATSFSRPAATQFNTENTSLAAALVESGGSWWLNIYQNVGGNDKIINRIQVTPTYSGSNLILTVSPFQFAGSAATATVSGIATPAQSVATALSPYQFNAQEMDAWLTAAGDARA